MKHPELFLPWMEQLKAFAPAQVDGLRKIFEKHRVPVGGRILDLASGLGRISINLAKSGYNVVGVDISPLYLGLAKEWAATERVSDRTLFYRMDARKASRLLAKREEEFDAFVNVETSMGYYGETEDEGMFRSLRTVAGPRAVLIVETVNRDYLVKHFQDHSIAERDGIEWQEIRKLDLESSFMKNIWKFYRRTRGLLQLVAEIPMSHRVYSLHELKKLFNSAGWDYLESYGSLRELTPLMTDSRHMTIVGRKSS